MLRDDTTSSVFFNLNDNTSVVGTEMDIPRGFTHVPWREDFPSLTVEHLLNDEGKILSSILFEDGNEVWKSYADGLLNVYGNIITYSFPDLRAGNEKIFFCFSMRNDSPFF